MRKSEFFCNRMLSYGDSNCIIYQEKIFTYSELFQSIYKKYEYLKNLGIKSGQIVFIIGDYSFDSIVLFFALALNKNIIIPVTNENETEIIDRLNELKADWVFNLRTQTHKFIEENNSVEIHGLIKIIQESDNSGLILFSSGSTGRPKAMIHNLDSLLDTFLDKKKRKLNFLVFLMFDHIGGLNTLLSCLAMGAVLTIPKNRTPNHICELIQKFKINVLPASPTFLNLAIMSNSFTNYDMRSLLMVTYGTEPMPESLLLRLKNTLPNVKFLQTFGTSETGIAKTTSKSSSSTFLKIDDPDQEYKIVEGELWLKSKTQILGYINYNNDCFTEDGWFKTGDLVETTQDGFLKIIGRSKEVINIGGLKVLPAEVENILIELPQVIDCKVKGVTNTITGQMVVADIVLAEGYDASQEKVTIRLHCRKKLDSFKIPTKINFVDQILYSDRFKKIRN
jgi:acyl-coenzyme A synthetase/AMP-(fatty) acid ligase